MPLELLLLLLAWAATVGLFVVIPWAVIRLTVRVLEAGVSKRGTEQERAQPHRSPDETTDTAQSRDPDDAGEPDAVVPPATADADADGADSPRLEARDDHRARTR